MGCQKEIFNAAIYKYAGQLREDSETDKIITSSEAVIIGKHLLHLMGDAETSIKNVSQDEVTKWLKECFQDIQDKK